MREKVQDVLLIKKVIDNTPSKALLRFKGIKYLIYSTVKLGNIKKAIWDESLAGQSWSGIMDLGRELTGAKKKKKEKKISTWDVGWDYFSIMVDLAFYQGCPLLIKQRLRIWNTDTNNNKEDWAGALQSLPLFLDGP